MDGLAERVMRVEMRLDAVGDRMGRLETHIDRLDTRLDALDTRLRGVEVTLGEIKGELGTLVKANAQLVTKLPSWWQMPAVIAGTVTLLGILYAGAKALNLV